MFNSAKIQAVSSHIISQKKYLADNAKPYLERFHAFLTEHNPHTEYVDYPGAGMDSPDRFILEVSGYSSQIGLAFYGPKPWGDDSLLIPFEYFDSPEVWEKQLLEKIAKDRSMVEKEFALIFGETPWAIYSVGENRIPDGNRVLNVYLTIPGKIDEWDSYITDTCLIFNPVNNKFYDTYDSSRVIAGLTNPMNTEDAVNLKTGLTKA